MDLRKLHKSTNVILLQHFYINVSRFELLIDKRKRIDKNFHIELHRIAFHVNRLIIDYLNNITDVCDTIIIMHRA